MKPLDRYIVYLPVVVTAEDEDDAIEYVIDAVEKSDLYTQDGILFCGEPESAELYDEDDEE